MTRKLLTRAQLAAKLELKEDQLRRSYKRLTAEHGFPAPIECFGPQLMRWDEAAIDAWLDAQSPLLPPIVVPYQTPYEYEKGRTT